jgi:hypothetical protein
MMAGAQANVALLLALAGLSLTLDRSVSPAR